MSAVHRLHLGEPLVDPFRWKADEIRALVEGAFQPIILNADIPLVEKTC